MVRNKQNKMFTIDDTVKTIIHNIQTGTGHKCVKKHIKITQTKQIFKEWFFFFTNLWAVHRKVKKKKFVKVMP